MKSNRHTRQAGWMFWLGLGALCLSIPQIGFAQPVRTQVLKPKTAPAAKTERPAWKELEKSVKSTLAQGKEYQPGDLITREEASAALAELKKLGWEMKEPAKLTERMLPGSDALVTQLRGKGGVRFMREIARVPEGFDRLDRLRGLPDGERRIKELMSQPGGATLIQYMATTKGGENMGRELSSKKRGDFNAATKRIYTEAQLLAELKTRYEAESKSSTK